LNSSCLLQVLETKDSDTRLVCKRGIQTCRLEENKLTRSRFRFSIIPRQQRFSLFLKSSSKEVITARKVSSRKALWKKYPG
jgi:hypothetical protein